VIKILFVSAILSQFTLKICDEAQDRQKILKTAYFRNSGLFKVIDVDTPGKLVASAYDDKQQTFSTLLYKPTAVK